MHMLIIIKFYDGNIAFDMSIQINGVADVPMSTLSRPLHVKHGQQVRSTQNKSNLRVSIKSLAFKAM